MSKKKQMTVEEYREKYKRCRTCVYSNYSYSRKEFFCEAKNEYVKGYIFDANRKGHSCILYSAKGFKK